MKTKIQKFIEKLENPEYVFNPTQVCEQLVSPIQNKEGSILVVRNIELVAHLRDNGYDMSRVHFSTNCMWMKSAAIHYGVLGNRVYDLEYNSREISFGTEMKFDIIIANPPYKSGLHLKFLDKALDLKSETGEIVFVHPAEWLVQKRKTVRNKHFPILKARISSAHIKFIENPWGKDAALFVPLSITHIRSGEMQFTDERIRTKQNTLCINTLDDIFQLGHCENISSILRKVIFRLNEGWGPFKGVVTGNSYVNLCEMSGGGFTEIEYLDGVNRKISNLYSLVNNLSLTITNEPVVSRPQNGKDSGNEKPWFTFNTREEAQNALDFISRTKFMRAWLAIIKIDQNAAHTLLPSIPWLDWTQEWTDEKLYEYFEFTQEEIDEVNRIIEIITVK